MDKICCIIVEKKNAKYVKKLLESVSLLHREYRITKLDNTIALPISFKHVSDNCCIDSLPPISCLFTIKYINSSKLCPSKTRTHFQKLHFFMKDYLKEDKSLEADLIDELLLDLPNKWDIHCDLIMFPDTSFTCDYWKNLTKDVWKTIAGIFGVGRVALKSRIDKDGYRTPKVDLKLGENGIVQHIDNGVKYIYDITKNMFSKGNITEKLRISKFNCKDEVVVDLFAGIGYFTLQYLMKANAKMVYACDWNPEALAFLKHNLRVNKVDQNCVVLQGDNRQSAPKNVAHRVNLGLIPSSSGSWQVACEALKSDVGGWLHVHENVESSSLSEEACTCTKTCVITEAYEKSISDIKQSNWCAFVHSCIEKLKNHLSESKNWSVQLGHIEFVKSYAPHIDHLVFDIECRPT